MPRKATTSPPTPRQAAAPSPKMADAKDPEHWPDYAVQWFRAVFFTKDVVYFALYAAAFGLYVVSTEPAPERYMNPHGMLISAGARAALTVLCALIAIVTLWIDLYLATAPEPNDRKWNLVGKGIGGHFCFLTVHILTTWTFYWSICAVVEVAWFTGIRESWVTTGVTAMYRFAVISSSLGTVLTILFLKFNWFEPTWRRDVLAMYESRGKYMFRHKILFTHLNQLPIAVLDCVVLKQTHGGMLTAVTPSMEVLLALTLAYCVAYLAFTHLNFRLNSGIYPYPFMDKLFSSWKSEIAFFLGLVVFVFCNIVVYRFVAVESRAIERFFLGD